jgi:hypothetical protein
MGGFAPSVFNATLLWVNISTQYMDTLGLITLSPSQWEEVETSFLHRNKEGYE